MADDQAQHAGQEARGCGMFDFLKKKDEDVAMADAEKKDKLKDEKHSLGETLKRSDSSSSSSSDEAEGEDGEKKKKKKKKGLREKIQEKISGEKEENAENKDAAMLADKYDEKPTIAEATQPEEKKGFLEKIKEKLPGQHKNTEAGNPYEHSPQGDDKEKKGLLEKIKEKLPGHHSEDEKAKHKET